MVLGFTGKFLQWWNNCLTEESKEDIKNAIQKDEEGTPIFDERIGRGILMQIDKGRIKYFNILCCFLFPC